MGADLVIKNGLVVDGTGGPARRADVAVQGGRIVAIGDDLEGAETLDATGQVVAPGFIDIHTHYDAQVFFDPALTPSSHHGVTTVVAGNCGFTLAPLHAEDAAYTREMLAAVEGMSVAALAEGVSWDWHSFADYLDRLDGQIGVNAAFLVGHCALRRYVMREEAVGNEASPEQIAEMQRVLAESIHEHLHPGAR